MERLLKGMIAGMVGVVLVIGVAWLFLREKQPPPDNRAVIQPATSSAAPPDTREGDPCGEAVVLTLQPHSGLSAQMAAQTPEGGEIPTTPATEKEGEFTTACVRLENDDPSGDASAQALKICKPDTFVLHITGSGNGVFDLQAKPLPEVAHPGGPLLLCNYRLDSDRVYDWVLKYRKGSRPAVFLLGSKGDPNTKP